MAKKPLTTTHKSRFEMLEDRRLLTTFNVNAPFTQEGSSTPVVVTGPNAGTYTYGGEDAFGDNANHFTATTGAITTPSHFFNNNTGGGSNTATLPYTYPTGPAAVWDYGAYDSGEAAANLAQYDYGHAVIPSTFDTYGTGGNDSGFMADGEGTYNGTAGVSNANNTSIAYVYGNNGLNGDGSGNPVPDVLSLGGELNIVNVPSNTMQIIAVNGPEASRFTAPSTGSYTVSATFTNPFFDPFDGPGGGNGDEPWTWDDGIPSWEVIQNTYNGGGGSKDNGLGDQISLSVPVASAEHEDITAVNTAHTGTGYNNLGGNRVYTNLPTPGNSITGSITSGSGLQVTFGSGIQNGSHGIGGTWTLYNAGTIAGGAGPSTGTGTSQKGGHDYTDDEYDLSWTVTKTLALKAGDSLDLSIWDRADTYDFSGAFTAPTYLAATVATSAVTAAPVLTPSGTVNHYSASPVAVDSGLTLSSGETDLTTATVTLTNYQSGDSLNFTNQNGISGSYASGVLTLTGSATPAQYQTALDSITFSTTSGVTTTRTITEVAGEVASNTANESVTLGSSVAPPSVAPSGSTGQTFTLGGSAVAVDSGFTVTAGGDANITGATETIVSPQTGDTLHFTNQNGISGSFASGVLTLSGTASVANYQTALESVTFTTTSTVKGTRTIDVVADDSAATPTTTSNTGVDTVVVAIAAPVVTANQSSVTVTAGNATATAVDSAVTVTSADTNLTGATVTIGTGFTANDTLHFTAQNGITIASNTGGVLTLTGTASVANYQTALQSVTFSNTVNNSLATRNISIVVSDSNANTTNSNTATTQILVVAPITVTGAWVKNPAWGSSGTTNFFGYLASHSLGSATLGYALQTGGSQLTDLPFNNINTISVSFSGAVSNIGLGSLKLVGGTGGGATGAATAAPSVTGFTSDGSNTYSWSLSGNLTNNKYVFAIATTGSSFGTLGSTQVTDSRGAGISGTFTTSSSTFATDGNGLAGSTFDFFFNVLPGDGNQNAANNSSDTAGAKALVNVHENAGNYNPYFDYNGAGLINSVDAALDSLDTNFKQSGITSPSAPAATQDPGSSGSSGFTALALGAIESGSSSSSSSSSAASNQTSGASTSSASAPAATTTSSGSDGSSSTDGSSSSGSQTAATDVAVSEFDLADLYV